MIFFRVTVIISRGPHHPRKDGNLARRHSQKWQSQDLNLTLEPRAASIKKGSKVGDGSEEFMRLEGASFGGPACSLPSSLSDNVLEQNLPLQGCKHHSFCCKTLEYYI